MTSLFVWRSIRLLLVWVVEIDLFLEGVVGIRLGFVRGPEMVCFWWGIEIDLILV